jgi:amino acid transporter
VNSKGLDIAARHDVDKLHGKAIGLIGVLFLTVTGAAPISAMLFNVPIGVGYGNGLGTPAAFLVATIILTVFSVGYAAMARKVTAAGGFYSFISHGLGREMGMAMGFGSVVAYCVFEASLAGGFAYFANAKILEVSGINVGWHYLALAMVAGIAALTYFDVKVSTVILGASLILEVAILVVFDLGVVGHNGAGAVMDTAALNPVAAFHGFDAHKNAAGADLAAGAAAIGLFFAFWSWVGFEMAPNYGEESRDPKRIVPLSLYISVISLGIFYTITAWCSVAAYPKLDEAITQAQQHSDVFFMAPIEQFVGPWAKTAMSWLILTSAFACGMAFHNTAARYLYSLGRERVLPTSLGKTHATYKSPYVASFTQSTLAAIIIILFAVFAGTDDPTKQAYLQVYGLMALLGTAIIMLAQALVSLSIIIYFRTHHPDDHHWFKTLIAPLVAFAAQVYIIYLLFANIDFLGGGFAFANYIIWIILAVLAIGVAGAFVLRMVRPETYNQIGRMMYEGIGHEK